MNIWIGRLRKSVFAVIVTAAIFAAGKVNAQYSYQTLNFPGGFGTFAQSINDSGTIAGYYISSTAIYGYIYQAGVFSTVSDPLAQWTELFGINNSGTAVGQYSLPGSTTLTNSFTYNNGTFTEISVPGSFSTNAESINNNGVVTGTAQLSTGTVGFTLSAGVYSTYSLPYLGESFGTGINNSDQITGSFDNGPAFIYDGGAYTDLPIPVSGGTSDFALGISDNGSVALYDSTDSDAWVYSNRSFGLLSVPNAVSTTPYAVNNNGDVVGVYSTEYSNNYAFEAIPNGAAATPSISSFSPASGSVGTIVKITGLRLTGTSEVYFTGGVTAVPTAVTATSVSVIVPSGAVTGPLSLSSPSGAAVSASAFAITPQIASFSPTSGTTGTVVTVNGSGFTGTTAVSLDGYPASFTFVSDAEIQFTVPAHAGTGAIHVKTPGGLALSSTNFAIVSTPIISSFTPTSGPVGTVVTVTGSSFTGATAVSVDGYPATYTFVNDTELTLTVPKGAGTGSIHIKNAEGLGASAASFVVIGVPAISGFTPTSGAVGTVVTVTGSSFAGTTTVSLDGYPASFTIVSNTELTFTVPKGALTGVIHVKNGEGLGASAANFVVVGIPSIASFMPTSGPVGTVVTVSGSSFTGTTAVSLDGYPAVFTFVSDSKLTFTVPKGAEAAVIHVKNAQGLGASAGTFSVN